MNTQYLVEYFLVLGSVALVLAGLLWAGFFGSDGEEDPNRGYHAGPYCG